MREIEFRGRDSSGNWHYGFPMIYNKEFATINRPMEHDKKIEIETLGQYTGLEDKNGTRIYEGDIVKGAWNTVFVVYYGELQYRGKYKFGDNEISYYGNIEKLEVIGNIYDNPELVNGE